MNEQLPQNRTFYSATIFLRHLVSCNLKHVVISPGSRSTPLTLAAASLPELEKHIVFDERSAAFLALGIAKATNNPSALICTSGTAVANYYPAVIEAKKSGVPMLLLTADRPARLHGTGANQTINQNNIFGEFSVWFKNMDQHLSPNEELNDIKKSASDAFNTAMNKHGPVHLNFPFEKPLEPTKEYLRKIAGSNEASRSPKKEIKKIEKQSFRFDDELKKTIQSAERIIIIIGQLMPSSDIKSIFELGEQINTPILTESSIEKQSQVIQGFDGFLRNEANQKALEPNLILRFGLQPASKSLLQANKKWKNAQHIYFVEHSRNYEIENTITNFVDWNGKPIDSKGIIKNNKKWLIKWKKAEKLFFKFKNNLLKKQEVLTDGYIYHHLSPAIPEDWFVFIGNSFPARDRSLFGRWETRKFFTNRGASGIDGITSTAMGVETGLNKSGILFTGDLSFLHDTNALLNKSELNHPLIIVVINNQGGSLFRMLPIVEYEKHFTPYFETPQEADIAALAKSYGVKTEVVESVKELKEIHLKDFVNQSVSTLQIIECRTDADSSMNLRKELWDFEL